MVQKKFKRFSITHGYRSSYTINQFRTNLDYKAADPTLDYASQNPDVLDRLEILRLKRFLVMST